MRTGIKRLVARAAVVAALVATTTVTAPPASAVTNATFTGVVNIGCFGCGTYGPSGNAASLWVNGVYDNRVVSATFPVAGPNGHASFTVREPGGDLSCLVTGDASGEVVVTGDLGHAFTWTRVGAVGVVTVQNVGNGVATFAVTSPLGNPCGGPVSALIHGWVVG